MKILIVVSLTILATYVQADFLPSEFFSHVKECFANNEDDKRKAIQCVAQLVSHRQKREFATGDEVALAKQVRICLDMGNTKETCYEKYADKIGQFDPMHFGMVVNYEAVLKELNEFLDIYREGKTTIRETLAVMKQNQAGQQTRQKREAPQPIQTLLIFHYFIRQCVEKNPGMNSVTCAAAMFGPDLSNLKERVSEFAAKQTEAMKGFYESTKGKASELADSVQGWFTEKFGRRKRDVASQVKEVAGAVSSQLKDVKEALTVYKDMIAACAQQSGQNVFTCTAQLFGPKLETELTDMKDTVQGWFSKLSNRQKRDMPTGDEVALAKQFTICLDMGGSKEDCTKKFAEQLAKYDPVHFNTVVNYEALLKQLNEFFKYYTPGKTTIREAIAAMNQNSQQRQKRDMPTQTEIGYAKAIKICLDMGNDKDACYAKVLGANIANVDMVKLQAIANYEEVLKELNQFLPLWNHGERTIREALLLLHQQQAAKKTRAFSPTAESLMELKTVVLECMNAWPSKDIKKCAIALFGTQIEGSDKLNLVVQLVNHPQVQEFARGAGQQLHAYMQSLDGFMGQLHSWAHGAYEYVSSLFG